MVATAHPWRLSDPFPGFPGLLCFFPATGFSPRQGLNDGYWKERTAAHDSKVRAPKTHCSETGFPHTCNSSSREILSSLSKSYSLKATGRKTQEVSGQSAVLCPFSRSSRQKTDIQYRTYVRIQISLGKNWNAFSFCFLRQNSHVAKAGLKLDSQLQLELLNFLSPLPKSPARPRVFNKINKTLMPVYPHHNAMVKLNSILALLLKNFPWF